MYLSNLTLNLGWIIILASIISPAAAHNIQVKGDVAGLWHIEPNHSPKAGENARAWVGLTRKGGKILPLSQANCQMAVYSKPRKPNDKPILEPAVQAINAEKYQGIPGADIIFPSVGLYQLELNCTPKTEGDFRAFEMSYDVTVATGTPSQPSPQVSPQKVSGASAATEPQETNVLSFALPVVIGLGVVGIAAWFLKKR
ncbi:hypothetical protein NIES4071_70680 [Calothrix sp. NIES-4071]|nr:hypothetical protein NIES4071_70680 [Calothrix sp. NIES-4071]BAZ61343.1 hypothetical protein NIES4105_70630 [Calothrix sp. NIES-4105]